MRERIARIMSAGVAVGIAAFGLAGCEARAPTGQVLASVGGDDVTKRDLAVEAAVTRLPPGPATLGAIVDRKLLVRRAQRERLDLTPDYLAAMRRFREATLATLAVQQGLAALPPPDDAAVRAFAAAHDWQFAGRRLVEVEDAGIHRVIDTAALPRGADARRLLSTAVGARVSLDGRSLRVLSSRTAVQPASDRYRAAHEALVRQQREALVRHLIEAERTLVRVRYQSGFGTLS